MIHEELDRECAFSGMDSFDNGGKNSNLVYWRLMRPHTLTASFIPVIIGSALALPGGNFRNDLALAMLLASMLIQGAVNMFNEYYDYCRGLDNSFSVGIGGAIVRDGMSPKRVFQIAVGVLVFALMLGFYIMQQSSWWVFSWGIVFISVGYLYSGGPWPISASPFGEIAAGSCMGTGIIAISYYIQTLTVNSDVILISAAPSVLVGAILLANNIRDIDEDRDHGRRTLAILIGREKAITVLEIMFASSYFWITVLIVFQQLSPWALLVLLSIPKAFKAAMGFRRGRRPDELMSPMVATAQTNTLFGLLLTLGVLLGQMNFFAK